LIIVAYSRSFEAATSLRPLYGEKRTISQSQKCCREKLVSPAGGRHSTLREVKLLRLRYWFSKGGGFGGGAAVPVSGAGLVLQITVLCGTVRAGVWFYVGRVKARVVRLTITLVRNA